MVEYAMPIVKLGCVPNGVASSFTYLSHLKWSNFKLAIHHFRGEQTLGIEIHDFREEQTLGVSFLMLEVICPFALSCLGFMHWMFGSDFNLDLLTSN